MTARACVRVDPDRVIGTRDLKVFGHFLEHFHRQIYGGVFDPGSPLSDSRGFRTDVIEALRKIRCPIIRWPGGCFASAYHWKDGVGARTPVFDKAWRVEEPNTFGTDEFVEFCRLVGAEPYICTNAGSGTPEEMSDWVEYCNLRSEGRWARLRQANGHPDPHSVRYWSIGNENYGAWEIGAKTADEWARFVLESAKMMKRPDAEIQLSAAATPELDWNAKLLREAGHLLDWISIHTYCVGHQAPYEICMARSGRPEEAIAKTEHILGALDLLGRIRIAYDEWNLRGWHHPGFLQPDPNIAERDLNDDNSTYTMADAVFAARFLNTCLRHCRTVGMANFSPAVNTRGAISTHKEGIVLRSTYHVFDLYANHTSSEVVDAYVDSPRYSVAEEDGRAVEIPYLDAAVTRDRDAARLDLVLVGTHKTEAIECEIRLVNQHVEDKAAIRRLHADSTEDFNDVDHPDDIRIIEEEIAVPADRFTITLPPHSVSVVGLRLSDRTT